MFSINVLHSDSYYLNLIKTLIRCLNAGFTDSQTAQAFNDLAILSPIGRPFTANTVTQILKKIRLYKEYPNKVQRAIVQNCFDGNLNAAETLILFQPRRQQGGM